MNKPPQAERFSVAGPAGAIECLLETAPGGRPADVAVLCHPHPLHGGTMLNKVVHTLARAAIDLGYAALRFNFRGVGASEGSYDEGRGERDDARAVIDWARQHYPGKLLLGGFSFGSIIAIELARAQPPDRLVSIAPPVGRLPEPHLDQPRCPWLIVQGDEDELVDTDEVVGWVDRLEPGPELIVLPGVDHFFHGKLALLRETLVTNLRD